MIYFNCYVTFSELSRSLYDTSDHRLKMVRDHYRSLVRTSYILVVGYHCSVSFKIVSKIEKEI